MNVNDLLRLINREEIIEDVPIVFVGNDGGWSNIDVKYIDGQLCILEDCSRPFSSDN